MVIVKNGEKFLRFLLSYIVILTSVLCTQVYYLQAEFSETKQMKSRLSVYYNKEGNSEKFKNLIQIFKNPDAKNPNRNAVGWRCGTKIESILKNVDAMDENGNLKKCRFNESIVIAFWGPGGIFEIDRKTFLRSKGFRVFCIAAKIYFGKILLESRLNKTTDLSEQDKIRKVIVYFDQEIQKIFHILELIDCPQVQTTSASVKSIVTSKVINLSVEAGVLYLLKKILKDSAISLANQSYQPDTETKTITHENMLFDKINNLEGMISKIISDNIYFISEEVLCKLYDLLKIRGCSLLLRYEDQHRGWFSKVSMLHKTFRWKITWARHSVLKLMVNYMLPPESHEDQILDLNF
jgi:hypothetical protein